MIIKKFIKILSSGEELNLLKKKEVTKTTRKLKYRIKKHTKGKTYYIRICGVNSKEVGKWSKIKK